MFFSDCDSRKRKKKLKVQDVLRCVLHTVLFNRALGLVRPREVDLDLFNISYVQCVDRGLERVVDEKVGAVLHWMERHPGKPAQVSLKFFEKRYKQAWFSKQEERLYWEEWNVTVGCTSQIGAVGHAGGRQRSRGQHRSGQRRMRRQSYGHVGVMQCHQ